MQPQNSFVSGILAEKAACSLLSEKGFQIIEQNYKGIRGTSAGEIDIIAVDEDARLLVFVEVKQRSTHALAGECITTKQQERIAVGAQIFLDRNKKYSGFDCRFDAILFDADGAALHLENAFGM